MIGDMKAGVPGSIWLFAVLAASLIVSCGGAVDDERLSHEERGEFRQLMEIRPEKPVHIKVKRNVSGRYSWELRGDDAERIIKAEKKISDAMEVKH